MEQKMMEDVMVLPGAVVCGDVAVGAGSGIWFGAVLRGDEAPITVGSDTNIQDNAVLHVSEGHPLTVGSGVTVGHGAILHGCTVGDNALIGMGAIVLDGASVGRDCIVGAGALVSGKTVIPDGWMAYGNPAKPVRRLLPEEIENNRHSAAEYKKRRELYRS